MNSQIESRPNSEHKADARNEDVRVQTTGKIWVFSIPLMALAIPIADITHSVLIPLMVAVAPALATLAVWYFGAQNSAATSAHSSENQAQIAAQQRIAELEERLANLETINNFERRLAEESLRRSDEQAGGVASGGRESATKISV